MKKNNFITINESNILKGMALIFMYVHHMFAYPNLYIDSISYPNLTSFAQIFKHPFNPVSIFCFITGYTYVFSKNKTLKQSVKKILKILIPFWVVLITFMIIGIVSKTYNFTVLNFLLEMLSLKRSIMCFCWYIYFYIIVMLFMPLIYKISEKLSFTQNIIILIFMPVILFVALKGIFFRNDILVDILNNLIRFYPTIIAGLIVSKYDIFNKIDSINIKKAYKIILCLFMLISCFLLKYLVPYISFGEISSRGHVLQMTMNLEIIYTPLFIYAFLKLIRLFNDKIYIPFVKIGKLSMLMWFTHCLFFNCSKEIFMPILYYPKNVFLVLIWAIVLNYILASLFNVITSKLVKLVK